MGSVKPTEGTRLRALVWHRRDLRWDDNATLSACVDAGFEPVGVFVFDPSILRGLPQDDRRVDFIHQSVEALRQSYALLGLAFNAAQGDPVEEIPRLCAQHGATLTFAGRDYEPAAKERDAATSDALARAGFDLALVKEHVVFESHEILTLNRGHFSVFTPYKNAWLKRFAEESPRLVAPARVVKGWGLAPRALPPLPSLAALGFRPSDLMSLGVKPGEKGAKATFKLFAAKLASYAEDRDFPLTDGTSRLGVHLRFGTISCRRLALWACGQSGDGPRTWLGELVWREFYSALLDRCPELATGRSFQTKYDSLAWGNDPTRLDAWKRGRTGIPLVDAGMRELLATGHMHNRVRMVAASYLAKHLDCDWRLGEAHFAKLLLDFDFASNNGGWQWSASTGCDAQPYFRIFNPHAQSARFDAAGGYIKRWIPELAACPAKIIHDPSAPSAAPALVAAGIVLGQTYPAPLVEHAAARRRALAKYGAASL